ncbi:hypothetical protein TrVE_jg3664 [Triparma verrucosa]|uniref:protein-disulfide reductase n=1 Tax=Triparma verrucosa TaxID=1606542 RepID=A0A9W7EYW4_9STRA|nr:hypothetical protein TrVE_jg3664 [Triparma verrucosa]
MDSPQSLPPPPPSSVPDAPFWVDYSTNSITVGWPQGKKSDLYHVQMGSIPSLDESAEGKEEKEAEEKDEDGLVWTTLAQKFGSCRVKKKNLAQNTTYHFRYRVRDSIDYVSNWSLASSGFHVLGEDALVSPTPRAKESKATGLAGSIFLEWDGVAWDGVEGYEIYMRPEDGPFELIGTIKSTEVRKKNLTQDSRFYFQIRVKLADGDDRTVAKSPSSEPISPCKPVSNYVASNFPSSLLCKVPRSVKANSIPLASALPADKIILLYFSAHWCGPCRQFTPRLVQFYNQYAAKYNFEVCFVSADHDEKSFLSYYEEEMPWKAVPYDDDKREMLQAMYKVSGIPSLRVLKSDGTVIDNNATSSPLNEAAAQGWVNGGASCKKGCCH